MEKAAFEEAWELAKKGDIEKISPRKRVRNYNPGVSVPSRSPPNLPALDKLDNLWIMGPTGCGKSRWVHQMYPNCYRKLSTKWWQGYNPHNEDHKIVVLDDLHPDTWQDLPLLKQWADHYPFPAEIKGGSMIIRPERIIVTSNFHPRQCFRREEDLAPILRRFQVVEVADLPPPPPQMTDEERAAALLLEDVEEAFESLTHLPTTRRKRKSVSLGLGTLLRMISKFKMCWRFSSRRDRGQSLGLEILSRMISKFNRCWRFNFRRDKGHS